MSFLDGARLEVQLSSPPLLGELHQEPRLHLRRQQNGQFPLKILCKSVICFFLLFFQQGDSRPIYFMFPFILHNHLGIFLIFQFEDELTHSFIILSFIQFVLKNICHKCACFFIHSFFFIHIDIHSFIHSILLQVTSDSSLSVIAQTFMDSCSLNENILGKLRKSPKLMNLRKYVK